MTYESDGCRTSVVCRKFHLEHKSGALNKSASTKSHASGKSENPYI